MKKVLIITIGAVMLLTGCGTKKENENKRHEDRMPNTTYWEDIQVEEIRVEEIRVEEIR